MKILVPLKQVADPDHASKIRVTDAGLRIDDSHLERKPNPFDEYALEAALRLTEDGSNPKARLGEVIVVSLGSAAVDVALRSALATGADRAIRVNCNDQDLDGRRVSKVLATLAQQLGVDWIVMGKQTVDSEGGEVAQRLAALLDWPQASFCAAIREEPDGAMLVEQEFDGGVRRLELLSPAVLSVDLRIIAADSVRSKVTPESHFYPAGVRFASLPSIMQARRKELTVFELEAIVPQEARATHYSHFEAPPKRPSGQIVPTVEALVERLVTEAKVL